MNDVIYFDIILILYQFIYQFTKPLLYPSPQPLVANSDRRRDRQKKSQIEAGCALPKNYKNYTHESFDSHENFCSHVFFSKSFFLQL